MSDAVFGKLTEKQKHVLGMCAIGMDGGHPRSSLASLVKRGLLEEYKERMGNVALKRYLVPMPIHIAWCQWCAEHSPDVPVEDHTEQPT